MKRNGTMFIQIQTGELLPLGMVNANTIQWQALPVDLKMELLVSVGFKNGLLYLPDLKLPTKHVLTGWKLFQKLKLHCNFRNIF